MDPRADPRTLGIRPRPGLWRRLDAAARRSFPALSAAAALVLGAAPLEIPAQPQLQQALALAAVFFWSLHRPALLPPPVVFALGLLADLLGLLPVGVSVLALLLTQALVLRFRRRVLRLGALPLWLAFAGVAAGVALLEWGAASALSLAVMPRLPAVLQFALATGLYPALALLLARCHAAVAAPELA